VQRSKAAGGGARKAKGLSRPDVYRLRDAIHAHAAWREQLQDQWVETYLKTVKTLTTVRNPDWLVVSMFWVRLNGVIDELYANSRVLHDRLPDAPLPGTLLWHSAQVLAALERIRASLSEDEKIFVDYNRQVAVHVHQQAYRIQGRLDQEKLRNKHMIKALGAEFAREDLWQRVGEISNRYADAHAAAIAFARKVAGPSIELLKALRALRTAERDASEKESNEAFRRRVDAAVEETLRRRDEETPK